MTPDYYAGKNTIAKQEAWYSSLSHYGDEQGGPSTIRELIEEIVWAALTVDLGPNGNIDPSTGIDEGDVYTNKLFSEWEREALRISGGINRDALLELADIVRCRDCVHFSDGMIVECERLSGQPYWTDPDGFCAWGMPRKRGDRK